jgi:hypothetical protein
MGTSEDKRLSDAVRRAPPVGDRGIRLGRRPNADENEIVPTVKAGVRSRGLHED